MKHITITLMISASLVFAQEENAKKDIEELDPLVVESSPLQPDISKVTQAWSGDDSTTSGSSSSMWVCWPMNLV